MRRRRRHGQHASGFTLIEALVSIAIAATMLLMIAVIFRQSAAVTRQVRSGAAIHQVARQVFEQLGRDIAGATKEGFIALRGQGRTFWRSADRAKISLYYDDEGQLQHLANVRTDMLVILASGHHISAGDASLASSFVRVIWGQTERVSGSDNETSTGRGPSSDNLAEHPEWLGTYQVLARNQTLLLPDQWAVDADGYGGSFRGPDYFNMGINDISKLFWAAMGRYDSKFLYGVSGGYPGGNLDNCLLIQNSDIRPWQPLAKVFRLGRDGPGLAGESAGHHGAGDLTSSQVNSEPPWHLEDGDPYPPYSYSENMPGWRGHERTRIYGPKDYHRIMAFAVPVFQVDYSDGRRKDGKLVFYPEVSPTAQYHWDVWGDDGNYDWMDGPGGTSFFAWNHFSPAHVRSAFLRKSRLMYSYSNPMCTPWGYPSSGGRDIGRSGWPWPKALRVRIVLLDTTVDPPVAYEFRQVFTLLAQ